MRSLAMRFLKLKFYLKVNSRITYNLIIFVLLKLKLLIQMNDDVGALLKNIMYSILIQKYILRFKIHRYSNNSIGMIQIYPILKYTLFI